MTIIILGTNQIFVNLLDKNTFNYLEQNLVSLFWDINIFVRKENPHKNNYKDKI